MTYPHIAFNTGQPPLWKREDELSNLSEDALNDLLLDARRDVDAMEFELRRRGLQPVPHNPGEEHYNRIKSQVTEIETVGLDIEATNNKATVAAHELKRALNTDYRIPQLKARQVAAGKFLCDVTRNCGCEVALICFMALQKHKLERMKKQERLDLLKLLKKNKSGLVPSAVIAFVTKHGFPSDTTRLHDLDPAKGKSLSRKRTWNNGEAFTFYVSLRVPRN